MGNKMIPSATYEWYIEPLDAATNEAISRELGDEDLIRGVDGPEDKKLNVWRCSFSFLRYFARSRRQFGLNFKAYNRRSKGILREYPFIFKDEKKTKAEKVLRDFQQQHKTACI